MSEPALQWQNIITRQQALVLQGFTCTTDFPRTPGGRRLQHDRPWEWEAQRHLRQMSQLLHSGDLVIAGRWSSDVVAAAHLKFSVSDDILEIFVAAAGVALSERHRGGALADRVIAAIRAEGLVRAADRSCAHLILTGKVHRSNIPSQRMVERAGWEPYGTPSSDYQSWSLIVPV